MGAVIHRQMYVFHEADCVTMFSYPNFPIRVMHLISLRAYVRQTDVFPVCGSHSLLGLILYQSTMAM